MKQNQSEVGRVLSFRGIPVEQDSPRLNFDQPISRTLSRTEQPRVSNTVPVPETTENVTEKIDLECLSFDLKAQQTNMDLPMESVPRNQLTSIIESPQLRERVYSNLAASPHVIPGRSSCGCLKFMSEAFSNIQKTDREYEKMK